MSGYQGRVDHPVSPACPVGLSLSLSLLFFPCVCRLIFLKAEHGFGSGEAGSRCVWIWSLVYEMNILVCIYLSCEFVSRLTNSPVYMKAFIREAGIKYRSVSKLFEQSMTDGFHSRKTVR